MNKIALGLVILICVGCSRSGATNTAQDDAAADKLFHDIETRDHVERLHLLALKYDLTDAVVETITTEYEQKHHPTNGVEGAEINLNHRATIEGLAKQLSISPALVAQVVIDYEYLPTAQHDITQE